MQKNAVVAKHVALLAIILLGASSLTAASEHSPTLNDLMDRADVIAAVKIQQTDYQQTDADGPMVATANVLKCIKGDFSPGDIVEFAETGWWGPDYKRGETRILFLKRREKLSADVTDVHTPWQTAYSGSLSFFIDTDALADLSKDRIAKFLRETYEVQRSKAIWSATVQEQTKDSVVILARLSSPDEKSMWICRDTLKVSFHGKKNGKDFIHVLEIPILGAPKAGPFIEIEADKPATLRLEIKREQIVGMTSVQLLFSNRALIFPKRCWSGLQSVLVTLAAPRAEKPVPDKVDHSAGYVLWYKTWSGVSPGGDFSHTSLIAVELDLSKGKIRKLMKSASRPDPMLPHDDDGIAKLLAEVPWSDLSRESVAQFSGPIQSWLATKPPAAYNSPMTLGHEDGSLTELSVSWGSNSVTTRLNPRGGFSSDDPLRPPREWQNLVDSVLGFKRAKLGELQHADGQ